MENQILWKMNIISSIEGYLMAHGDDSEFREGKIVELARGMATAHNTQNIRHHG